MLTLQKNSILSYIFMKLPYVIIILLLIASCSQDNAGNHHDKQIAPADTTTLTYKVAKLHMQGAPIDTLIAVQSQAVDEMRNGLSPSNPVEVLEQMGFMYNLAGDYLSAVRYYEEATDSLKKMPYKERNEGAIQLFGDLSSLYSFLGIHDKALEYSDSAVAESKRQGGLLLSDVYKFRANVYQYAGDSDSALQSFRFALEAVDNGPTRNDKGMLRDLILTEIAYQMIDFYGNNKDSVAWAVRTLEGIQDRNEIDLTDKNYALGLGYARQGRLDEGLALINKAYEEYEAQEDMERLYVADKELLALYARYGMADRMMSMMPRYLEHSDSLLSMNKMNAVIGSMVRYNTKATEDRNKILALQLKVEREDRIINYGISIVLILALLAISVIFYQRSRILAQKKLLQEKELIELNEYNTRLGGRVNVLEKDLSAGMNSNSSILSEPQLITGKDEGRFRRAFNVLFPYFIPELKEEFPKLTQNDELLCMLLFLKHTTDEISVYLGISKASVNSARYRLRTKFSLPKDVDLDNFITGRSG